MWNTEKIIDLWKMGSVTHNQEKRQVIETGFKIIQMLEYVDGKLKTEKVKT